MAHLLAMSCMLWMPHYTLMGQIGLLFFSILLVLTVCSCGVCFLLVELVCSSSEHWSSKHPLIPAFLRLTTELKGWWSNLGAHLLLLVHIWHGSKLKGLNFTHILHAWTQSLWHKVIFLIKLQQLFLLSYWKWLDLDSFFFFSPPKKMFA